jgi:pimeloyl-[acyl-carrier protein] methyl ester esterase
MTSWLHGWASSPQIWGALPAGLDSSPRFANFVSADSADALDAAADAVISDVIIGWSLGGILAIGAAARHPKRVRRLVLIATTPRFTDAWPARVIQRMQRRLAREPEATIADFQARAGIPDTACEARSAGLDYLANCDLRSKLAALPCPILWIHGDADPIIPASSIAPRSTDTVCILPGLGHAPFLEDPSSCELRIREFLP